MLIYPATTQIFFEARKCWYIDNDQEPNKHTNPNCANLISGERYFWLLQHSQELLILLFVRFLFEQKPSPGVAHLATGGGTFIPAATAGPCAWLQAPGASFIHAITAIKHMFLKLSEVLTPYACQCSQMSVIKLSGAYRSEVE